MHFHQFIGEYFEWTISLWFEFSILSKWKTFFLKVNPHQISFLKFNMSFMLVSSPFILLILLVNPVLHLFMKPPNVMYPFFSIPTVPCSFTISWKYKSAIWDASNTLPGTKGAVLEKWSATTIIESLFLWVLGKPTTKSKLISSQGALGIKSGVYKPVFWPWALAIWQIVHCFTYLMTSWSNFGQ